MTFISYSQNLEDVLLHRALKEVDAGTYVDVGAADPELDSVTKAFYDLGWTGINIEPWIEHIDKFAQVRPRDVNLCVAAGSQSGVTAFHLVDNYRELSTTVSSIAENYANAGRAIQEFEVPVRTLASICAEHINGPIHFLKVDVEGAELDVLEGADFSRFRPWIVLVESITFGSDGERVPEWDTLLVDAGYVFAYFDGLNRFYVASEKADELLDAFRTPVNVRDDFKVAVAERSETAFSRIAEILGLDDDTSEHEVIERAGTLLNDRISFEKLAARKNEELRGARVRIDELASMLASREHEVEALNQQSFERERHIAWLAMQRALLEARINAQLSELHAAQANHVAALHRINSLLSSSSWRIALPLRALRHPLNYMRKLLGR